MAEATRFKDLLEAQKKIEQLVHTESIKWQSSTEKLQENHLSLTKQVEDRFTLMLDKMDHFSHTLATLKLQFLNNDKGKGQQDDSLLGNPDSGSSAVPFQMYQDSSSKQRQVVEPSTVSLHTPFPRVDFPKFDGSKPRSWILKCNNYFKLIPSVPNSRKVTLASMHFEGKAALWYQNIARKNIDFTWS